MLSVEVKSHSDSYSPLEHKSSSLKSSQFWVTLATIAKIDTLLHEIKSEW